MPDLSIQKQAQRLRIYIGESDRWRSRPLDAVLLETIRARGIAGATIFRGYAGFGAHSRIHSAAQEALSVDLPILIEVIDSPAQIKALLDVVYPMVAEGLITLEEVQVVKYTHRGLNPLPAAVSVREVMTREPVTLSPQGSIAAAWRLMLERRVKALPVVDEAGQVVGILTGEDLLERAGLQQRLSIAVRLDPAALERELQNLESSPLQVAAVMTHPVVCVRDDDSLGTATDRMVKSGLKRLPVTDAAGRLVGLLSRLDVLQQVARTHAVQPAASPRTQPVRQVRDLMSVDVPSVSLRDDLATIVEKFARNDVRRLIVVDEAGRPVGLLSDSDVVARVQPQRRGGILAALRRLAQPPAGKETAADLMSPGVIRLPPETPALEALQGMLSEGRKCLVVVDEAGRLLGMVDRQDMLEDIAAHFEGPAAPVG